MLHVVYSNRTEKLLEALVRDVEAYRAEAGPFAPVTLVVPNRNVETWVRFGLARLTGIAANLEVHFLRGFLGELLSSGSDKVRVVDGELLRSVILSLLLDDRALTAPELAPVRDYLGRGASAEAGDLRRLQLSAHLARLFDEYAVGRPELLARWPGGTALQDTAFAAAERWQRALWLLGFGPDGLAARRGREEGVRWVLPGELSASPWAERLALPPRIHVFGVSYVARAFQRLFSTLARRGELRVYTLNPCREHWEDVADARVLSPGTHPQPHGEAALEAEDPFGFEAADDTPLLRLWGRPGRENIKLLNELTDCDFEPAFVEPSFVEPSFLEAAGARGGRAPTLLQRLQQDVLDRAPLASPSGPPAEDDGSVRILACPGIRREAEVIAGEIWALLRANDRAVRAGSEAPLRCNEIAVVVAGRDKDEYLTHLSAALGDTYWIPHNVVDRPFAATSRVAEAVQLLLALPEGAFTRAEVLRLLSHPCVAAAVPEADPATWLAWCDRLGIVHGAEHADHAGTYIEADRFNWDHGLRRLALGTFLDAEREPPLFEAADGEWLALDLPGASSGQAARFLLLARSLLADARFARTARLTLTEWAQFFDQLAGAYVRPTSEEEVRDLRRLRRQLLELSRLDPDQRELSFALAAGLARETLGGLSGGRGQHLADGVVLSSFQPMRALPFRVIFVAGLGEGRFPASDRRDDLDLRLARRRAGDVSAREQDRYMFLETLLCARERLYLSYVSRNALTGDALPPSSVISELQEVVARSHGEPLAQALVQRHPLRRHDPGYFPELFPAGATPRGAFLSAGFVSSPEARREALALAWREHIGEVGASSVGSAPALVSAVPEPHRAAAAEALGLCPPPGTPVASTTPIDLPIAALRRFLEDPLQGHARHRLRLSEDEEDLLLREDEPLECGRLDAFRLLAPSFLDALASGLPLTAERLEAHYDLRAHRETLSGRMPVGVLGEIARSTHRTVLAGWREGLKALLGETADPAATWSAIRVGSAREDERADVAREPVVLDCLLPVPGSAEKVLRKVRLHGRVGPLLDGRSATLHLEQRNLGSGVTEDVRRHRRALTAFLEHLLLAASGDPGESERRHAAWICISSGDRSESAAVRFAPVSAAAAREQLTALAEDLLGAPHAYLLPCEAVLLSRLSGGEVGARVRELLRRKELPCSSRWGPVRDHERYPVPGEAQLGGMVERRFGLFFQRVEG